MVTQGLALYESSYIWSMKGIENTYICNIESDI